MGYSVAIGWQSKAGYQNGGIQNAFVILSLATTMKFQCYVQKRMDRLLIYEDTEHDFDAQYMFNLKLPSPRERPSKLRWNLPEGFEPVNAAKFYHLWRGADGKWAEKLALLEAQRATSKSVAQEAEDALSWRMMQGMRLQ
jgi:hypothetical protein